VLVAAFAVALIVVSIMARAQSARETTQDLPDTFALYVLGRDYEDQGRLDEAEAIYKRLVDITEKTLSADSFEAEQSRASLKRLEERRADERSEVLEKEYNQLASEIEELQRQTQLLPAAMQTIERYVAITREKFGEEAVEYADAIGFQAATFLNQGRLAEAEPLIMRELAINERAAGAENLRVTVSLDRLGVIKFKQGHALEAEKLFQRSLIIREKMLGPGESLVGQSLLALSTVAFAQSKWTKAVELARRGTSDGMSSEIRGELIELFLKASQRLAFESRSSLPHVTRETFEAAQRIRESEVAEALAKMALRGTKRDAASAALVREQQDLAEEIGKLMNESIKLELEASEARRARKTDEGPEMRSKAVVARQEELVARLGTINEALKPKFPEFWDLSYRNKSSSLSVEEVQSQIGEDEALVLFFDTSGMMAAPEETFVWIVTKNQVRWTHSEFGTQRLKNEVAALRCGLDAAAWHGTATSLCPKLLNLPGGKALKDGEPLPFDHARAHALYKSLFGEAEDLIKGKHLLVVLSGALTQLPLQALVTMRPPIDGNHKKVAWLVRSQALTVLPAVSSLKALRRVSKPSAATKPMIGFGNPLLEGDQQDARYGAYYKRRAELARVHKGCAKTEIQRTTARRGLRRSLAPLSQTNGLVSTAELRAQSPLPETADELCAVARDLKADVNEVRIGSRATETELKSLSRSGKLAEYRVVHFATHGTLAGQLTDSIEPGLILTPPASASAEDDGYLSASEIANLKLDADWVILSACNTAGPSKSGQGDPASKTGVESLSGLARAFFYAQARALLVSHWEVDSDAAVKLVTGAISASVGDKKIGRAEALRRAILALIDNGAPQEAHPAHWAPFVLVGEGGAGR
jgi:CHAT domain-containing protein/tetratricopeptide (TPR) repeat protein